MPNVIGLLNGPLYAHLLRQNLHSRTRPTSNDNVHGKFEMI